MEVVVSRGGGGGIEVTKSWTSAKGGVRPKIRRPADYDSDDNNLRDSEEDEDDEDYDIRSHKRKKRKKGSEFIIEEAEVDEDAEEDEDAWDDDGDVIGVRFFFVIHLCQIDVVIFDLFAQYTDRIIVSTEYRNINKTIFLSAPQILLI